MKLLANGGSAPVKLLKFVTSFGSGGTEHQVLNLSRNLDRLQFDLRFGCLRRLGDILADYEKLDTPITEFHIRSLYRPQTVLQQLRFAAHLRAQRIQIVHSYNFHANMFTIPAARMAGVPVVLASIRDQGVYLNPAQKLAHKCVCQFADKILVNATSIRQWLLAQGYRPDKLTVLRNGVDMSLYEQHTSGIALRRELGIPESSPIVVMLSRLNPQKGVAEFIRAAAMLAPSHPNVRFLIVGTKHHLVNGVVCEDTQYLVDLQQLAHDLGIGDRVMLTGRRGDTAAILMEAAISVLPSHSEGLSNTLLESMAAGTPTVATNVGGNPELVKDHVNGLLVPVKSPQRLAAAIASILDNPSMARRFSEQAKHMARENFSLAKMAADTQAFYLDELRRTKRTQSMRSDIRYE